MERTNRPRRRPARSRGSVARRCPLDEQRRCAVRDDADLFLGTGAVVDEQAERRIRHDDDELGVAAERLEDPRLVRRRLREDGVQGHDERLRQLFGQRHDVFAVAPAEDAVLVLEQNDVDVPAAEDASSPDVVAACSLRDRRNHARTLRPGRIVDDHDLRHGFDLVQSDQRGTNVCGERPDPARTRWVRGDDGRAQPCGRVAVPMSLEHRAPRSVVHRTGIARRPFCAAAGGDVEEEVAGNSAASVPGVTRCPR